MRACDPRAFATICLIATAVCIPPPIEGQGQSECRGTAERSATVTLRATPTKDTTKTPPTYVLKLAAPNNNAWNYTRGAAPSNDPTPLDTTTNEITVPADTAATIILNVQNVTPPNAIMDFRFSQNGQRVSGPSTTISGSTVTICDINTGTTTRTWNFGLGIGIWYDPQIDNVGSDPVGN